MAKGSGSTRSSSSGSPRGLSSIRKNIQASIAQGGADWSNRELVELRDQEFQALRTALNEQVGKDGWMPGFNNIHKDLGDDSPIRAVSVDIYQGSIEDGSYYRARVAQAAVSLNSDYTEESHALWNNEQRFSSPKEAIKWIEKEANKINKKYKGKI